LDCGGVRYDHAKIALQQAQAQLVVAEARAERLQAAEETSDSVRLEAEMIKLQDALDVAESTLKNRTSELERLKGRLTRVEDGHTSDKGVKGKDIASNGDGKLDGSDSESQDSEETKAEAANGSDSEALSSQVQVQGLQALLESEREVRGQLEDELATANGTIKSLTAELTAVGVRHTSEVDRVSPLVLLSPPSFD
jgi:predicted  nucleic acid-binding Zn-ribbon protein